MKHLYIAGIAVACTVVLIVLLFTSYCALCHIKARRRRHLSNDYAKVGSDTTVPHERTKDDFEILFQDLASDKLDAEEEINDPPQAILKAMVPGTPDEDLHQIATLCIENLRNFLNDNCDHFEQRSSPPSIEWSPQGYSPAITNPLLDGDGLNIVVARWLDSESFWVKIWHENINTILDFQPNHDGGASFWPRGHIRQGDFDVVSSLEIQKGAYIIRSIFLRNVTNGLSRTVSAFTYRKSACDEKDCPLSPTAFNNFLSLALQSRQNQAAPAGPILMVESPLMSLMTFVLFGFDAIAARTVVEPALIIDAGPAMEKDEKPVPITLKQLQLGSMIILEDLDRSVSLARHTREN